MDTHKCTLVCDNIHGENRERRRWHQPLERRIRPQPHHGKPPNNSMQLLKFFTVKYGGGGAFKYAYKTQNNKNLLNL